MSSRRSNRRSRGSLTRELILDAGEQVARSGVDKVTIRLVAAEAKAAPMALYTHFQSKEELVDALLDRLLGRLRLPEPSGDWSRDLRSFAQAHREFLETVPWALPGFYRNPFPGPNSARIGEYVMRLLIEAGFDPDSAFVALSGIIALNYGAASFIIGRTEGGAEAAPRSLEQLDPARFPKSLAAAGAVREYASNAHYEMILGWLLTGLMQSHKGDQV